MPSGKVHDRITLVGAAVAAPVFFLAAPPEWRDPWVCGTLVGATLFSGLMLSPDLDLDSSIYRRWGPFRVLWWPYQKALPHRSFLSHSLVLAPALRIAYFFGVSWLLFRLGTWLLSFAVEMDRNAMSRRYGSLPMVLYRDHPHHFWMLIAGILLGTALHVGADVFVSNVKKRLPHHRSRRRARH
jgi:uncharacterized metal-binding protein